MARESLGESVFSLPRLEKLTAPPLVGKFFSELARGLIVPRTSRMLLGEFAGIDVTAERVAALIRANPAYEFLFMRHVRAIAKREEVLHLESAVVLFGMQNSRNWLVGLQLHRQLRGAFPDFDAEGRLITPAAELVKYATRAEDAWSADRDGYADTAYLAGLHFDLLAFAAAKLEPARQKAVHEVLEELYAAGVERAQVAARLARALPKFSGRKYVFSACLLSDIGKAAMALLEPGYLKFVELVEKAPPPRAVRVQAELERFGTAHAALSSWIVQFAGLLRPIAPALEFHHDPVLIRGHAMHELAALVSLATVIASDDRKPASPDDPLLSEWLTPDLQDLGLSDQALAQVKA
jgi:hypothetical protein